MSDMVKASPLSARDTLEHVLPMVLGAALFAPYLAPPEKLETVFIGAALFSYILHTPLKKISKWTLWYVPILGAKTWSAEERMKWWGRNWNFDALFYEHLDEKEREYAYLTAAYASFYRLAAFFFLVYLLIQIVALGTSMIDLDGLRGGLQQIARLKTPIVGGWEVPALGVILISAILFVTSMIDYLRELSDVEAIYDRFATKHHRSSRRLAVSVWGWIRTGTKPVPGATVKLVDESGAAHATVTTDEEGKFQFVDQYGIASEGGMNLVAQLGVWTATINPTWTGEEVPCFRFEKPLQQHLASKQS